MAPTSSDESTDTFIPSVRHRRTSAPSCARHHSALVAPLSMMSFTLKDFQKFHLEDEGCAGRDAAVGPGLAVSQLIGDVELPDGALAHKLETFGPSCDHLVQAEHRRLAAVVGAVELDSACKLALIEMKWVLRGIWGNMGINGEDDN